MVLLNENIIGYMYTGSVMALFFLLALGYCRYRIKQISRLQLQQKQNEIDSQQAAMKKLLEEREWLVREVHHRVKNNLQIVISLLNTQSAYLDNKDALSAIHASQHRMYTMSLIHQRLYQSDSLSTIDMNWYIHALVDYMIESLDEDCAVNFALHTEQVALNVVQAVPLGLILNEAVSNVLKYAFPGTGRGTVHVYFTKRDDTCMLVVEDDGVGLPQDFELCDNESLGMSLIKGLSEQLDGQLRIENKPEGLKIYVSFATTCEPVMV
ncbi:sensor histidine kinase [Deminuibacter soli]|uniref:histidine kinase n=1 Tax=Deminuibacter soli TaxID=2291815 RepID=A0A3E1NP19_9BACT|nr:sensor histidine kinase [Deminuibacter soli]RFM29672.1 sensor histidine kinase [Deminuibacter soli]